MAPTKLNTVVRSIFRGLCNSKFCNVAVISEVAGLKCVLEQAHSSMFYSVFPVTWGSGIKQVKSAIPGI